MPCLVDTNVGVAANLKADVSDACALCCIDRLLQITREGHLVLDDQDLIFEEYRRNLHLSGRPGVGDQFMLWVHNHRFNPERCTRVPITPTDADAIGFDELRARPHLTDFDPADKKFLATALAHGGQPPILVACDTDYWHAREALEQSGVAVEFLCQADIQSLANSKG